MEAAGTPHLQEGRSGAIRYFESLERVAPFHFLALVNVSHLAFMRALAYLRYGGDNVMSLGAGISL